MYYISKNKVLFVFFKAESFNIKNIIRNYLQKNRSIFFLLKRKSKRSTKGDIKKGRAFLWNGTVTYMLINSAKIREISMPFPISKLSLMLNS